METKWKQSKNKNSNKVGNKVGTRTLVGQKWKQRRNKVGTRTLKWNKNETKWKQSENKNSNGNKSLKWDKSGVDKNGSKVETK